MHEIVDDVYGWRGDVVDANGQQVGHALFQLLHDESVVGTIEIPGVASLKIFPTGVDGIHEVVDIDNSGLSLGRVSDDMYRGEASDDNPDARK